MCLLSKENKPIGTSILQLSITDHDSSHNGPPFDFHILSGNDGDEFVLEKDGTLVTNQVFRRELAAEYILQIQVDTHCYVTLTFCNIYTIFSNSIVNHPVAQNNTSVQFKFLDVLLTWIYTQSVENCNSVS